MVHAGALAPAIEAMMDEDPARRWDMATSARRLGGIAGVDATAVMPVVEPGDTAVMSMVEPAGTAVMPQVTAVPPVEPTKQLEVAAQPPDGRGSGRRRVALAFAAFLVAAIGMAFLLSQLGDQGSNTAAPATTRATAPAKTAAPSPSKSSEEPSTRGEQKAVESFVKSYYADVTKETDRTWDLLSPRMQDFARGRENYDDFWKTIDKVRVNQVRAYASGTKASVDLTFTRDDGSTSTETHQLTFVTHDGDYLIDSDRLG